MEVSRPPTSKGTNVQDVLDRMDGFRNLEDGTSESTGSSSTSLLVLSCVISAAGCMLLLLSIVVFCCPSAPLSSLVIDVCNSVFKGAC